MVVVFEVVGAQVLFKHLKEIIIVDATWFIPSYIVIGLFVIVHIAACVHLWNKTMNQF